MKERRRYIVFRVHSDIPVDFTNMKNAVWNSLLSWVGERELSEANVWIIRNLWNSRKQEGFVRCTSKYVDHVKVGMSLVHNIGDAKVIFQTLRVSGTIKSARSKVKVGG